ncbi:MAG TPA: nuclear transport factor 2 family protein [Candidatus Acidoferrum sp.]|nr:nuclear transport factor 2 family protein [Candidatus Acidoferrum sp.]
MDTSQSLDSPAVKLARSHLEAWTNHDMETARGNLAEDVQFFSPAANLAGIDEYMEGARGLVQFAKQVVPGSLRIIAATGDERNALIMYEVRTEGGPFGARLFPTAQTWVLDDNRKIKTERIVSIVIPLNTV